MPQFRFTAKLAKDLKIKPEQQPSLTVPLYDDWYVDLMRAGHKKIVVFMHVNTLMALAITCFEIGGIKNMFKKFPYSLKDFFYKLNLRDIAEQTYNCFNVPREAYTFTKTNNLSVMRYITDFKYHLAYDMARFGTIDQEICNKVSEDWLNWLLKPKGAKDYITPMELIEEVFR